MIFDLRSSLVLTFATYWYVHRGLLFYFQDLTSVAYDFYNEIIVMTLDASQYLWWASKFVPAGYGRSAMRKLTTGFFNSFPHEY